MFGHSPLVLFTHEDIEILRKPIWVAFHVITQFVLFYQRICPVISISCTSRSNKYNKPNVIYYHKLCRLLTYIKACTLFPDGQDKDSSQGSAGIWGKYLDTR